MNTSLLFGLQPSMAARIVALVVGGLLADWALDQRSYAESYSDVAIYGVVAGVLVWMAMRSGKRGEALKAWGAFLVAWAAGFWAFQGLVGFVLMVGRERDWFDPSPEFFGLSYLGLSSLGLSLAIMLTPLWFVGRWASSRGVAFALYLAAVYLLPMAMKATFEGALMFKYSRGIDFTLALSAIEVLLFVASVGLLFTMILRLQRPGPLVSRNLLVGALVLVFSMPFVLTFAYTGYGLVQGSRPLSDIAGSLFMFTIYDLIVIGLPLLVVWLAARRPSLTSLLHEITA